MEMNVKSQRTFDSGKVLPEEISEALASAECLYTDAQIDAALSLMSVNIERELAQSNPVILSVMVGALIITGKLVTRLSFPMQIDYVHVSRYRETTQGGEIDWYRKPSIDLKDRVVLVVDDILDEGHTLAAIIEYCRNQGARRILSSVLVQKQHDRKHPEVEADFVAYTVDDRYVFGYGMDYKSYLRNLPGIYALNDS